jgi:hypothetical protein
MEMTQVRTVRGVAIAVAILTGVASCAPIPIATTYPISTQQKMQAADHWRYLADQVADEIGGGGGRSIYVIHKGGSVFGDSFETYLGTALFQHGYAISNTAFGATVLDYSVEPVVHRARRETRPLPGIFTALGGLALLGHEAADHWDVGDGYFAAIPAGAALDIVSGTTVRPTNSEVIITVTVSSESTTAFRKTVTYYVADADLWQYPKVVLASNARPIAPTAVRITP